jgi:DNA ligase-1
MTQFKPMLAGKTDGKNLTFPVLASPKLDGVRAIVIDGRVMSRSLKEIPNAHVQKLFGKKQYEGLDGELGIGEPTSADFYRKTMSGVMSADGEPDAKFFAFDDVRLRGQSFRVRQTTVCGRVLAHARKELIAVPHVEVKSEAELLELEAKWLAQGFEGAMIRSTTGPYKCGRSTEKEGWLLKLKRFEDSEAEVLGCYELMHNANEATKDELGRTKRSSHKANKQGRGTLGGLHVRDLKTGVEFNIGTGFDDALRVELWSLHQLNVAPQVPAKFSAGAVVGRVVKYKFFPTGSKDKPRFPVFLGFRDLIDM